MSRVARVLLITVFILVLIGAISLYNAQRQNPNSPHNNPENPTNSLEPSTQSPILILEPQEGVVALWNYKNGGLVSIERMSDYVLRNIGVAGDVTITFHPLVNHARYGFVEGDLSETVHLEGNERIRISYTLLKGASPAGWHVLQGLVTYNVDKAGEKSLHADFFGAFLWNYDGSLKEDFGVDLEMSSPVIVIDLTTAFLNPDINDSYNESYRVQTNVAGLNSVKSLLFSYTFSGWSRNPDLLYWTYSANWSSWAKATHSSESTYWYDIPRDVWIDHVGEDVACKTQIILVGDTNITRTAYGKISDDDTTGPLLTNPWSTGDIDYSSNESYRIQITATDPSGIDTVWFRYKFGNEPWSNGTLCSGSSGSNYWYDIPRDEWHRLYYFGVRLSFEAFADDADNDTQNDQSHTFSSTHEAGQIKCQGIHLTTFININKPDNYWEFRTDSTFLLSENDGNYTGRWIIYYPSYSMTFFFDNGTISTGQLDGNTLVDRTGETWVEE